MVPDIFIFEFAIALYPMEIGRVEMKADNSGDVREQLSKLKAWNKVKQISYSINPWRHIQIKENFLDNGWLRQYDVHDH